MIHEWFTNVAGAAATTGVAFGDWRPISDGYGQVRDHINKILADSGAVWEGQSADAMQAGVSPMAALAEVTSSASSDAAARAASQSGASRFVNRPG